MNEPQAAVASLSAPAAKAKRPVWVIMAALIFAEVVSTFEGAMIYAALKSFYRLFDDPVAVGWLLSGYMLVASVSAAIFGRLGDMYGRRRLMLVVLAIASCGSLVSALTSNLTVIIAGRAMQGAAGAILPLCYGIIREHVPSASVPVSIGIIAATVAGGAGLGMVLGGILVDFGGWRYIFLVSAAVAALAFVAVWMLIPASKQTKPGTIDWIGALLFLPGVSATLYALSEVEGGWNARVATIAAVGGGALIAWFIHEYRHEEPLIDVRLMLHPQIGLTLLIWTCLAIGAANIAQIVMVMLQQSPTTGIGLGISATMAGVIHSPASLLGMAAGPLAGWLAGRSGARTATIMSAIMIALAWTGLFFAHGSVWAVGAWIFLNGFGMGAAFACIPNLIVEVAPAERTSEATGLAQITRKIMSSIGAQAIAVSLATSTVASGDGGRYPDAAAYRFTYGWIAAVCILAAVLSFALPRRARKD